MLDAKMNRLTGFREVLGLYRKLNLSLIPIVGGGKKPLISWQEYQTRPADDRKLNEWYLRYWSQGANIGIVCGKASGNLVVLDFDDRGEYWRFIAKNPDLAGRTLICQTPNGNHVYLRTRKPLTSRRPPIGEHEKLDIKGQGGCVVAPPSLCANGTPYAFINPEVSQILQVNDLSDVGIVLPVKSPLKPTGDQTETYGDIARLIEPYWNIGNRHDLALSLSAFLIKLGWATPMIKVLVKAASEGARDEDLKDRLKAVDDTSAKHGANMPIRGFGGLEEILPQTTLLELEKLAKSVTVPPLIRKVDDIRLSAEQPFLKKRKISQTVIENLKENGKFLRTSGNELFYFDGVATPLESPECKAMLSQRFGLNPTEQEGKYVLAELEAEALNNGEAVTVHRLAHWDRDRGFIYVHGGDGKVYRLDSKKIDTLANGDEGVYFATQPWQLPFEPDFEKPLNPWDHLTDDLNFEVGELVALSPEQQNLVARLLVLDLFFLEELSVKPIFCVTGDKGSGKSFFLRRVVRLLYGSGDLVEVGDKDDFHAALSANHLLPLDDIEKDTTPRWLIPELKRAATGQEIALRKLYSTNTEIRFTPQCFIAFTSINPPIDDSAFADRLVILRLSPRNTHRPESEMLRTLKARRNGIWAGLLSELNQLISKVRQPRAETRFRLADWASFSERVVGEEVMDGIIQGLTGFQNEALFENSPIPAILELWDGDGRGDYLSTAELYEKWKTIAENHRLWFPYGSPRSLGMHLENIKHNLKQAYGVRWQTGSHRERVYLFP